jgi:adenylate kinase family enzyme
VRVAVLGNSGSGKSTLSRWIAQYKNAPLLDLDTVAWEPGKVAVARSAEAARSDVHAFCSTPGDWIVEGCYASLIEVTLEFSPLLLFLNPGEARCIDNCRARRWEPHKYASREEQDERLDYLLTWVRGYYTRAGDMSLTGHLACYGRYAGRKAEVRDRPPLDPPSVEALGWLS